MKRVAIIGPTGMLGSMVYNVLKNDYKLTLLYRSKENLKTLNKVYKEVHKHHTVKFDLEKLFEDYAKSNGTTNFQDKNEIFNLKVDFIINCAGIIKPYANTRPELTFFINSAFPHMLSSVYKEKLIQITTDCIFSGLNGAPYNEKKKISPTDLYGLSKSIGEPKDESLVLRTSIIGPEITNHVSLISWFQKQKKANGFTHHCWNGMTTKQFAKVVKQIISSRSKYPRAGLFHIFSNPVTKYQLLLLLKSKYNPLCEIVPFKTDIIDRRLSTVYKLNSKLKVPSLRQQIQEL